MDLSNGFKLAGNISTNYYWLHSLLNCSLNTVHGEQEISYQDIVKVLMAPHGLEGTGLVNPTWELDQATVGCDCEEAPKDIVGLTAREAQVHIGNTF